MATPRPQPRPVFRYHNARRCVALVTGSSRGIGQAIALGLALDGYTIAVNYCVNAEAARETVRQIREHNGRAEMFQGDISNLSKLFTLVEAVNSQLGPPLVLINNAASRRTRLIQMLEPNDITDVMHTNFCAPFRLFQLCLPHMQEARFGRVVNISSLHARLAARRQSLYAASKAALESFTRAAALEYAPENIRVNAIQAGIIATDSVQAEMGDQGREQWEAEIPMNELGRPHHVADLARFLVSDNAHFIQGAIIPVDGGLHLKFPEPGPPPGAHLASP